MWGWTARTHDSWYQREPADKQNPFLLVLQSTNNCICEDWTNCVYDEDLLDSVCSVSLVALTRAQMVVVLCPDGGITVLQ